MLKRGIFVLRENIGESLSHKTKLVKFVSWLLSHFKIFVHFGMNFIRRLSTDYLDDGKSQTSLNLRRSNTSKATSNILHFISNAMAFLEDEECQVIERKGDNEFQYQLFVLLELKNFYYLS